MTSVANVVNAQTINSKINKFRGLKRGLVFATVITGGIFAGSLIKTVNKHIKANKTEKTEIVNDNKTEPNKMPYVWGTLFSLGLLGSIGASSAKKKQEQKLDEFEAGELNLPVDIYQAIKYEPEIKQAGCCHPYENTLSHALYMYPAKTAPVIEQIIDFWKEKYNLNIIEEEKEPELRELLKEAANHTNDMTETLEALKNRQHLSDIFVEVLVNTYNNSLKYPGINWRGSRYLETGKVNTDRVLINGIT